MSFGSWPFLREQCPRCRYLHRYVPVRVDDKGYEVDGFCRHPQIAMELFSSQSRPELAEGRCRQFVPGTPTVEDA